MKIFSLFASKKIKPLWLYSSNNVLWRVMFSHNGLIIIEDRNTKTKTVSFSCISSTTGNPLWKNKSFGEQWWIGLEGMTNDRLYLHGFKKPDMPEHKNIITVDVKNGDILWQNNESTFLAIQSPFVYGYKDLFERRVYYSINETQGKTIEELQTLPENVDPKVQYEKNDFIFPRSLPDSETELWDLVRKEIESTAVEYIMIGKYLLFNAYIKHTDSTLGLKNTFYIIDSSTKKKVYFDVLNQFTPYAVPDSFFVDENKNRSPDSQGTLYYIKERKTLVVINL